MILSSRKGNFRGGFDRVIVGQGLALKIAVAIVASVGVLLQRKKNGQ
jgi:hypothetical protein